MSLGRFVGAAALAVAVAFGPTPVPAAASGSPPPAKATCAPGDANVLTNPKTKRYVLDTAANVASIKKSGASGSVKSACESQAKKAGARRLTPAESKRMGHP